MKFIQLLLLLSFVSQLEAGFLPRVALRTGIIRRTMGQQALAIRLKNTKAVPKLSDKVLPKETGDLSSFGEVIPLKHLRQKKQDENRKKRDQEFNNMFADSLACVTVVTPLVAITLAVATVIKITNKTIKEAYNKHLKATPKN